MSEFTRPENHPTDPDQKPDQPTPDPGADWREMGLPSPEAPKPRFDPPPANDERMKASPPSGPDGLTLAHFATRWQAVLDPPIDLPDEGHAEQGKLLAVKALVEIGVVPQRLIDNIGRATTGEVHLAAPGATVVPLQRRTGAHTLYALAREIGVRAEKGKPLDRDLLAVLGAYLVRRLLQLDWMPPEQTVARLRAALVRPEGRTSQGWQAKGRQRALTNAIYALHKAVVGHAAGAAVIGLGDPIVRKLPASDPLSLFNRAFRRRVNNLTDFASKNSVNGATGYGTLSRHGLRDAGSRLLDREQTGDLVATHICWQIISHLPSDTMQMVPVVNGEPPDAALAWLDAMHRTFNYRLFHLMERGARPAKGAEACYEITQQVVSVDLSPFLGDTLQARFARMDCALATEADLVGKIDLHPQDPIDAKTGYKVTVRRVQESIPAHLLQMGLHRWPVALATNSQFLLSRGRPAYSICLASRIAEAVNAAYDLLNWPRTTVKTDSTLIGSFVTPRPAAISEMINGLADRADRHAAQASAGWTLIDESNAHAAWVAAVLALCLALRDSVTYEVIAAELAAGIAAHIDDKHVHAFQGPPVPVVAFLRHVILAWRAYCLGVVARLQAVGDIESEQLAKRIQERVNDPRSLEPVFVIDPTGHLQGVGTSTWHSVLTPALALQDNFGRHFWPYQLMALGVSQLAIDIVMRHQLDGIRPAGSNTARSRAATQVRLRQAMDAVITALALRAPRALHHE